MSESILHGKLTTVDESGNTTTLYQETTAVDVLVDRSGNTTVIPTDIQTLQNLVNKLGKLSLKSKIEFADLTSSMVVANYGVTQSGTAILDAVAGNDLNRRLELIEDSDLLYASDPDNTDIEIPESEINDDVTSESSTWSSAKIERLNANFYISLEEQSDGSYTTDMTLSQIADAYGKQKLMWVTTNDLHLPLIKRNSDTNWVFAGYSNGELHTIQITGNSTSTTVSETVTSVKGIHTAYDPNNETVTFM